MNVYDLKNQYPKEKIKLFCESCSIMYEQDGNCQHIKCQNCPFFNVKGIQKCYRLIENLTLEEQQIKILKFCKDFLKKYGNENQKRIFKFIQI
jgi:hypothetical protein